MLESSPTPEVNLLKSKKVKAACVAMIVACGLFLANEHRKSKAADDLLGCYHDSTYVLKHPEMECIDGVRDSIAQCDRSLMRHEVPAISEGSSLDDWKKREEILERRKAIETAKGTLQKICPQPE